MDSQFLANNTTYQHFITYINAVMHFRWRKCLELLTMQQYNIYRCCIETQLFYSTLFQLASTVDAANLAAETYPERAEQTQCDCSAAATRRQSAQSKPRDCAQPWCGQCRAPSPSSNPPNKPHDQGATRRSNGNADLGNGSLMVNDVGVIIVLLAGHGQRLMIKCLDDQPASPQDLWGVGT